MGQSPWTKDLTHYERKAALSGQHQYLEKNLQNWGTTLEGTGKNEKRLCLVCFGSESDSTSFSRFSIEETLSQTPSSHSHVTEF